MQNKTEATELSQTVQFSKDHSKTLQQSVYFDPAEDWVILNHDGHETPLSRENFEKLMDLGRRATSGVMENRYNHLKKLKLKDAAPLVKAMTDLQIRELAKEDSKHGKINYRDITGFTRLLVQELFRRNGLGYKSMGTLSFTQKKFLDDLGIYEKNQ